MEENRDYRAYRYGDHLTPGSELKIEHSVVCENVDISTLITMGTDSLEAMRQGSIDGEQKAYEIVVTAAKQWEQQAAATQTINRALEYLRTPEIEHTGNQWKDTDNWRADQKISNRVYQMTCSIWEDTKYDRETKQSIPVAWYVTWEVRIHSPYAAEIESGLKSLQAAVGGDIQAVYPYEDPVALICNDEGKLMGLPLNRALFDDDGHVYDIVSGNFLIVGLGEEDFTDLSPDLMEKYGEQFKYPEKFARIAGEIIAVKQPATNEHREKPMMHHSGPDL